MTKSFLPSLKKQYSPLLAAFTTQGQSELTLLLKIQKYCYDNIHFMKAFQKIVVLFYKGNLFFFIKEQLIYNIVPISAVQQGDPVTCVCARTCVCVHILFLFLILSSIMVCPKRLDIVPCAIQQDLIVIHSKCNTLHPPTPNSQSIPLPLPQQPQVCSPSLSLFMFCRQVHLCCILGSTYKLYHMVFVFIFLIHLV